MGKDIRALARLRSREHRLDKPEIRVDGAANVASPVTYNAGFETYRARAETILGTGPGLDAHFDTQLSTLKPERRQMVVALVAALCADEGGDDCVIATTWAQGLNSGEAPAAALALPNEEWLPLPPIFVAAPRTPEREHDRRSKEKPRR